jgi:hypothetical protein
MKNSIYTLLVLGLLAVGCKPAQPVAGSSQVLSVNGNETSLAGTQEMLYTLSADSMEGRQPGSMGMDKTARFLEISMVRAGVKPYFSQSYRDTFYVRATETYNLVGSIGEVDTSKPIVLLGAHYDHIGKKTDGADTVYNGANDNASGVTAVLQIAARLAKDDLPYNVLVALFSGEESGLLGSKHLAERLKNEGVELAYMLNFEMIGVPMAGQPDKVYITGYEESDLAKLMNDALGKDFVVYLPAEKQYQLFKRSDNYPFYQAMDIPAHTICTFDFQNYNYYHQLEDEAEKLDVAHMERIIESCYQAINKIMQERLEPELRVVLDMEE